MKKIINLNEKTNKRYSLLFSVVFNAVIMLLMISLCNVFYEMDDDAVFAKSVTDGFYETAYINCFLLRFMGLVEKFIYPISAFVIVSLTFAYMSCCTITNIMVDKFGYCKGGLITVFLNGCFAVNYYLTISFTRLPGLLATAGFLAIVHYAKKKNWYIGVLFGMILVTISALYRFSVFKLSFGFACAFVGLFTISEFVDLNKADRSFKVFMKKLLEPKRLVAAAMVLVLAFSLNVASKNVVNNVEGFTYYKQYTSARSQVYDFPIPTYEQAKDDYDAIGITENDIALFKHSYVDDKGPFTLEKLSEMKQIQNKYNTDNKTIVSVGKEMLKNEFNRVRHFEHDGINIIIFLVVFLAFLVSQKKKKWFIPILISGVIGLGYLYVYNMGRPVYRVFFPMLFSSICYMLYMTDNSNGNKKKGKKKVFKHAVTGVLCVVIAITGFVSTYKVNYHSILYPKNEQATLVVDYAKDHPDDKFIAQQWFDFSAMLLDDVPNVFYAEKTNYDRNYFVTSGVYYASPMYEKHLAGFGAENAYEELLKPNVYFVSNVEDKINETMQIYLQEHYSKGKTVEMQTVDTIGNYTVYNYSLI